MLRELEYDELLSTPHGALGTGVAEVVAMAISVLSTPHGALGT